MGKESTPVLVKEQSSSKLSKRTCVSLMDKSGINICNYYGRTYMEVNGLWKPLTQSVFNTLCYRVFDADMTKSKIQDLAHYFMESHNRFEDKQQYIYMGGLVWDMDTCDFVQKNVKDCFFRTLIKPNMKVEIHSNKFVMDLACNDEKVYDDIFNTLSTMFSWQKPDMVGFFVGDGSNGKSVLISAINEIIGNHLSNVNLTRLTDQRDAPLINGTIANLCGENSDSGVIEDSQVYKAIGSHEPWNVHRMHTNDVIEMDTNPLHIFCLNNMPNFTDKTESIIRRAMLVPFNNTFEQNPEFRTKLLSDQEFLSNLLGEMLLYAKTNKAKHWRLESSDATKKRIHDYEQTRNSAKTYVEEMIYHDGMYAFANFTHLKAAYSKWCEDNSMSEFGVKMFRAEVMKKGFERKSNGVGKVYILPGKTTRDEDLYGGIYTRDGIIDKEEEVKQTKHDEALRKAGLIV